MDKKGVSVNRTGENKECYESSLEYLKNSIGDRLRAVAELEADFFTDDVGLHLKYCPIDKPENIYHSEIHKSENEAVISRSARKKLSEACKIIS